MIGGIKKVGDIDLVYILAAFSVPGLLFCSGSAASICYSGLAFPVSAALAVVWAFVFVVSDAKISFCGPVELTYFALAAGAFISLGASGLVGWTSCATFVCVLSVAFFIVRLLGVGNVVHGFVIILELLAIISLVGFIIFEIIGVTPPFPKMMTHTASTTYSNALLFVVDLGMNSGRNVGLFWEPSIFAAYINIAIAIVLFCDYSDKRNKRLVLFFIVLLTTESAGGLIELLCILISYWYREGSRPLVVVCLVALIMLFILSYTNLQNLLLGINYDLFYKFFGGSNSGTTQTRLECPVLNLRIWLHSPVFGNGFYGADILYDNLRRMSAISNLAQTSTITYLPAAIGAFGFSLLLACLYGFLKIKNMPVFSKIALLIAFMVFLNEEPCTYFIAVYLMVFIILELSGPNFSTNSYLKRGALDVS